MANVIKIPKKEKEIMQTLIDNKFEAYVVGGAIRDSLLGLKPKDWDLFTDACGEEILALFPQGKVIGGEERQAKILTVVVDGVEVSQYRASGDRTQTGSSLEAHLKTCDFTVNAVACDIDGNTVDKVNGLQDINERELRFVGDGYRRVKEDPLRLLRGIRILLTKTLVMSTGTGEILFDCSEQIKKLSKERVRDELMKIIKVRGLRLLYASGYLSKIIPELKVCEDTEGGDYHDEKVLSHLFYTYNTAQKISENPLLHLAAFLHDIGKGATAKVEADGKLHFLQHEKVGAEYVKKWMAEYKFSEADTNYVVGLIRNHMWSTEGVESPKAYIKFFNQLDKYNLSVYDYLYLKYCDNQGNMKNTRKSITKFLNMNKGLISKYYELQFKGVPFTVSDLTISGKDLIAKGMQPGPAIGKLLKEVFELVMDGELVNERPVLMHYIKEKLNGN